MLALHTVNQYIGVSPTYSTPEDVGVRVSPTYSKPEDIGVRVSPTYSQPEDVGVALHTVNQKM